MRQQRRLPKFNKIQQQQKKKETANRTQHDDDDISYVIDDAVARRAAAGRCALAIDGEMRADGAASLHDSTVRVCVVCCVSARENKQTKTIR
jgi:hypothetical protein